MVNQFNINTLKIPYLRKTKMESYAVWIQMSMKEQCAYWKVLVWAILKKQIKLMRKQTRKLKDKFHYQFSQIENAMKEVP